MTPRPPRRSLALPVFGGGIALSAVAAAGTAALIHAGVWPLGAAAIAAGVVGLPTFFAARRFDTKVEAGLLELRKELEAGRDQALARERLLDALVEATPYALLFYADAGRIIYANAEARRLFFEGQTAEGQNFLRLVAQAPEALRRALLGESDELFNVELDGQRETYHLSRRTFDFDGETHTLLLVRHLTFEISRREVDVLRRVIRIISHELNNSLAPVASLVHSARLIAKNPEHLPKLDRVFDTIQERAEHLQTFLNGYATLARLPKPRPAEVAWEPLLDRLRALFPGASIPGAGGATAWFDAPQIEQLLINLLKNANEAGGEPGAVELTVTAGPEGGTTIRVADRGKGLTPEALESAFLPLYSTKEGGSGMGLALCREVVEAHGGRVSITNRDGGGCSVTCWVPPQKRAGTAGGSSRARLTLTRS